MCEKFTKETPEFLKCGCSGSAGSSNDSDMEAVAPSRGASGSSSSTGGSNNSNVEVVAPGRGTGGSSGNGTAHSNSSNMEAVAPGSRKKAHLQSVGSWNGAAAAAAMATNSGETAWL
ncbi:sericin-1-like [Manacus vitellinus]|uniref:sericin-1-like n=1 Tax=Manacus vitellinus TaxID=328815 RepID=UPI000847C68E|nr:sericin-1-like [Manacus vitellinus]